MKHIFFRTVTVLVLVVAAWSLPMAPTLAQRTDSLMTKSDVIMPVYSYYKTELNGFLYYLADDGKTGYELWRTDGTTANTKLVKDIRPGRASAFISDSTSYYVGLYNSTLSRYVYDAATAKKSLSYVKPYVLNNKLYFWADDGVSGIELWQSDGTEAGTTRITDLLPGAFDSADQYDIIYGGYYNRFSQNGNKLLFWSNKIQNYAFETNGTVAGTREINVQTNKYLASGVGGAYGVNGQTFIYTYQYIKGQYLYTLLQDNGGTTAPTALTIDAPGYASVMDTDTRGPIWSVQTEDAKQRSTTVFRQEAGKAKLVKRFDFAKPATGTSYPNVSLIGRTGDQILLMATNDAQYNQTGRGTREIWRMDAKTDSVQLVRRFVNDQTFASNTTRYAKGSENASYYFTTPTGLLLVHQTADTTGTAYRNTASYYDPATNKLQVVEDSMNTFKYWNYGPKNQMVFVSRKSLKEPYRAWTTNGKTKQTLKTLGVAENLYPFYNTDLGLVAHLLTYNFDSKKNVTGYKQEVWKLDTIAANVTQVGQVKNGTYIGSPFASNGVLYGNNSGFLIRVSSATPTDSIRLVAYANNFADYGKDGNYLGMINGKLIGRPTSTSLLMAIDPAGKPKRCTVNYITRNKNSNPYSSVKDMAFCPAKDSVVTMKRSFVAMSNFTGEINTIYYNSYQWLRDSTVMQSGASDSLKLRQPQQGQYNLTLRGQADGCQATDTYRVFYSNPSVSLVPNAQQTNRKGVTALTVGGYPINNNYYTAKWERVGTDGAVAKVDGADNVVYPAGSRAWLDEFANNKYEPRYGSYNLTVTEAAGCTAATSYVFDEKTTFLTAEGGFINGINHNSTICDQSLLSYTATAGAGKAPYTYRWLTYGLPVATGATGSFVARAPLPAGNGANEYMVEVTDADGKKMLSPVVRIAFAALPNATLTASSPAASATKPVVLSAVINNYSFPTFAWAKDGQVVTGVAGRSLTVIAGGVYSVTVGSGTADKCQRVVSTTLITGSGRVASPEAVARQSQRVLGGPMPDGKMTVIPNPVQDVSRLQLDLPKPAGVRGTLLTTDGKTLHTWEDNRPFEQYTTDVNLINQPSGVYLLRIEAGGKVYTQRLVKP